jgi:hypothetical protein
MLLNVLATSNRCFRHVGIGSVDDTDRRVSVWNSGPDSIDIVEFFMHPSHHGVRNSSSAQHAIRTFFWEMGLELRCQIQILRD